MDKLDFEGTVINRSYRLTTGVSLSGEQSWLSVEYEGRSTFFCKPAEVFYLFGCLGVFSLPILLVEECAVIIYDERAHRVVVAGEVDNVHRSLGQGHLLYYLGGWVFLSADSFDSLY